MTKGKNNRVPPFWAAVVFCHDVDSGQLVGSFLSFHAQNRYKALEFVRGALPDNPQYLDNEGKLRPFQLLDLRQIKESDSAEWAARFYTFFYNLFPQDSEIKVSVPA
jgi:hypothetical protein